MKFNALQKYLLKVYAVTLAVLTIFVPTYTATGALTFGFILFGYVTTVNIAFLLTEYFALTLALIACLLATSDMKK
ncbi:MAG: hypothetical protein PHT75_02710 [Bacilli bacterium]|nr:hypothetical protein [Bacilli bacterium]MDD3305021.1 hypothetical protein [Bacilli bacterium]MDD4053648.1 hypothetical protein [Bacilli bacterium]MDD4411147.1 hypothetical protein [Bacilli bacterium]